MPRPLKGQSYRKALKKIGKAVKAIKMYRKAKKFGIG